MTQAEDIIAVDRTGAPAEKIAGAYKALGAVVLRDFFAAERVAELAAEADRLFERFRSGEIGGVRVGYRPAVGGDRIFERFDPVCDISPLFERIARDPRLLELAGRIVGGAPFLFKDKIIYKFANDRGYEPHQDFPYYDLPEDLKDGITTAAITIDAMSQDTGPIEFYLGCHDAVQPAPQGQPRDVDPQALAGKPKWSASIPQGSLILFHTLTPHASGPNRSGRARRLLYFTYARSGAEHLRNLYYRQRASEQRETQ